MVWSVEDHPNEFPSFRIYFIVSKPRVPPTIAHPLHAKSTLWALWEIVRYLTSMLIKFSCIRWNPIDMYIFRDHRSLLNLAERSIEFNWIESKIWFNQNRFIARIVEIVKHLESPESSCRNQNRLIVGTGLFQTSPV